MMRKIERHDNEVSFSSNWVESKYTDLWKVYRTWQLVKVWMLQSCLDMVSNSFRSLASETSRVLFKCCFLASSRNHSDRWHFFAFSSVISSLVESAWFAQLITIVQHSQYNSHYFDILPSVCHPFISQFHSNASIHHWMLSFLTVNTDGTIKDPE